MSNKNSLVLNNSNLLEISNTIQNLPESVHWTGGGSIIPGDNLITIPAYTDSELIINPVPTEQKTVTPSNTQQIITPSIGKYLNQVIVKAAPSSTSSETGTFTPAKDFRYDIDIPTTLDKVDYFHITSSWIYPNDNNYIENVDYFFNLRFVEFGSGSWDDIPVYAQVYGGICTITCGSYSTLDLNWKAGHTYSYTMGKF